MTAHQITSTSEQLLAKARAITGINDVADPEIEEPLRRLLNSLNNEAQLNVAGVMAMEKRILRTLTNRLRMFRDYRDHPEIDDQEIVRPLMLTGGGRTGSTKLHQLIAASGDFKYMTFWQAFYPSLRSGDRAESPDARIRDAEEFVQWFNERAPRAVLTHPYETLETEEETHLYEMGTFGFLIFSAVFVPSFIQWYGALDFRPQVEFFKKTLKYLQWQFHDGDTRPWVLKYPGYQGFEPILRQVFPDAVFATTYRDPLSTLTSGCSLFSAYYEACSDASFDHFIGLAMMEGQAARLQIQMNTRRDHPDMDILDISYADLLKSTDDVIKRIYAHAGMNLGEQARNAMLAWEQKNAQHKHGVHKYTLEQFGLTPEIAQGKYSDYIEQFGHLF